MSATKLVVILPNVANILQHKINAGVIATYLEKIVKKASFQPDRTGLTRLLFNHFSQIPITGPDLPMASLMSKHKFALRADPCYLHPDRDGLLLLADDLELTLAENQQLLAQIQPLLEQFGGKLVGGNDQQWLVHLTALPDVTFYALPEVVGKSVENFLPIGATQQDWIRLWNEIQMQLYSSAINEQRVNAGKLPINSVWFWGAGEFVAKDEAWASIHGSSALLNHLAAQSNNSVADYSPASLVAGDNLWLLDDIDTQGDWQQQLQQLDQQVFAPLWQHCTTAKIANIQLQIPNHGQYHLTPVDCWKFW